MELRHLRYFVAIAEERSFTGAAERLWIAQPGLSTQMRRLEAELGVQLLERHSRGINLTQAGELFLERARVALAATDVAAATGRDLEDGVIGSVRLGVASGPGWPLTLDLLARFSHERPGVELSTLQGYGGTLWRELRDGHLDALLAPGGHGGPDLETLDLGSEPWVVLTGSGHRLAGNRPLAATQLTGERVAVTGHRDGSAVDRAQRALARGPRCCGRQRCRGADHGAPGPTERRDRPGARAAPNASVRTRVAGSEHVAGAGGICRLGRGAFPSPSSHPRARGRGLRR
jgi:DNA-binding transcriptional LysR family regulator